MMPKEITKRISTCCACPFAAGVFTCSMRNGERPDLTDANWCPKGAWAKTKITGLGDVIAAATKFVGIKPCGGCEERREILNKLLPNPLAKPPSLG